MRGGGGGGGDWKGREKRGSIARGYNCQVTPSPPTRICSFLTFFPRGGA